ncbi:Probable inactive heme oxygenase 2-chloroplastic [Striga hermonthica]|uniref:Probable inactive heme oxygenase 2-chloroplastic n=1 Tax=Striga hermonthica TaxID=68872 RepID=A0A9N7NGD4_STRHE|nr:Probable inactive heme oxygenase 2-chloroplastic [Striga hermonthica]
MANRAKMVLLSTPGTSLKPLNPLIVLNNSTPKFFAFLPIVPKSTKSNSISRNGRTQKLPRCTISKWPALAETEHEEDFKSSDEVSESEDGPAAAAEGIGQTPPPPPPPVRQQRRRYRKAYPGEKEGITEEMRFVAMRLRNSGKSKSRANSNGVESEKNNEVDGDAEEKDDGDGDEWQPSMEGFLKYLVDSELVFRTVESIVDESTDVSYVYFRKTGLERSGCIMKDLEWLREQGNVIPEPSNPGVKYMQYLKELAENSPPLFLSHFYNIYFSHIAGGQVIAKKVSSKLLEGRKLEFYKWEGDAEQLLTSVREKLNALGEHWSRDEKNKCLSEATKAFRFLGQIVRLIILSTKL